jgi:hypothetical protein
MDLISPNRHSMRLSDLHQSVLRELTTHQDKLKAESKDLFGVEVDLFVRSIPEEPTGTVHLVSQLEHPLSYLKGVIGSLVHAHNTGRLKSNLGNDN